MENPGKNSDLIDYPQVKTLREAKQKFASSDYSSSHMSENHLSERSESADGDFDFKLTITQASVLAYRQWAEEWGKGWKNECFASLPVLSISDEWLQRGEGLPFIDVVLTKDSTFYEPGDHALAFQCLEHPELLNQIRWLNLAVCRDNRNSGWVIWDYDALNAAFKESVVRCSHLPKTDHSLFLLRLLRNINLCAEQFCPLTRDIAQIETDTRIGALSSMLAVVTECLIGIHIEKDYDLSEVMKGLIGIAHFSGCDYILFDSLQWFIA